MMLISQLYNVGGVGFCKHVLLHPILISIIFEHYKRNSEIQGEAQKEQKGD